VDGAVAQRLGERVVHEPVLIDERQSGETRARNRHLEVVAAARSVLDAELVRIREGAAQQ